MNDEEFHLVDRDPLYERVAAHAKPFMEVFDRKVKTVPIIKKRSFAYLFFRDIGRLLSPKHRNYCATKLMPLPHPFRDLWYKIYGLFKGKAWREQPWAVKISFEAEHYYIGDAGENDILREAQEMVRQYDREVRDAEMRRMLKAVLEYGASLTYDPPKITQEEFDRWMRVERSSILLANGTMPRDYFNGGGRHRDDPIWIRCETCGHVSYRVMDCAELYCPICRMYVDRGDRPGRQREIVELIEARDFQPIKGRPHYPIVPLTLATFEEWLRVVAFAPTDR